MRKNFTHMIGIFAFRKADKSDFSYERSRQSRIIFKELDTGK